MIGFLAAGALAGFSVGFVGAGAAVIGLPFLLYLDRMPPSMALGTNALGVAFTAGAVLLYRLARRQVALAPAASFALPGLVSVSLGTVLGRFLPGSRIVFLLGFVLFVVAGWMFYLSLRTARAEAEGGSAADPGRGTHQADGADVSDRPAGKRSRPKGGRPWPEGAALLRLGACGGMVGVACGFFAVGGGFMIIPAFMLMAGFPLVDAIATGLLPFSAFSLWIGGEYWLADSARIAPALLMACSGVLGGVAGIWLSRRLEKATMQRVFALLMLGLGLYIVLG